MRIPIHQVDAFTSHVFHGNPAAVCPLERWLPDDVMQSIAAENNLPETAFVVRENGGWKVRWFTPGVEMDLCGHATLASGWVVFHKLAPELDRVTFESRSGPLTVSRAGDRLAMDLPARPPRRIDRQAALAVALGAEPREVWLSRDVMAVFDREEEIRALAPDLTKMMALEAQAVIVTAPGSDVDFVSRFFAPALGVPEDPVTGSAHCTLVPWWSKRLGRPRLRARQLSARGGEIECEDLGESVRMIGDAVPYLEGFIEI